MSNQYISDAIFLDADGVLWKDVGAGGIFSGIDHAIQNLKLLSSNPTSSRLKIVISNQTFAARNGMSYLKFKSYVKSFFDGLIKEGLLDDFAICYHHPNAKKIALRKKCKCRKPLPGLLHSMARKHQINMTKSVLIGDRITDMQAGDAAGIKHLFLIINDQMLEVNTNSTVQPIYQVFLPLKELNEYLLVMGLINED